MLFGSLHAAVWTIYARQWRELFHASYTVDSFASVETHSTASERIYISFFIFQTDAEHLDFSLRDAAWQHRQNKHDQFLIISSPQM